MKFPHYLNSKFYKSGEDISILKQYFNLGLFHSIISVKVKRHFKKKKNYPLSTDLYVASHTHDCFSSPGIFFLNHMWSNNPGIQKMNSFPVFSQIYFKKKTIEMSKLRTCIFTLFLTLSMLIRFQKMYNFRLFAKNTQIICKWAILCCWCRLIPLNLR